MKSNEILELVRAGYTKAEIAQMDDDQQDNQQQDNQQQDNQQDNQQQDNQQDNQQQDNQQDNQQQDNQTVDQRFAAINATLDKMVQTMQRMAIRDSKQPDAGKGRTPEQVLEDVVKLYN